MVNAGAFRKRRSAWRVSCSSVSRNGEALLVAIVFLACFHRAELQHGLAARFDRRQAGANVFRCLQSEVFLELLPQTLFVLLARIKVVTSRLRNRLRVLISDPPLSP